MSNSDRKRHEVNPPGKICIPNAYFGFKFSPTFCRNLDLPEFIISESEQLEVYFKI